MYNEILRQLENGKAVSLYTVVDSKDKENIGRVSLNNIDSEHCEVFAQTLSPPPLVVICGAGHVGIALYKIACMVGFSAVLLDERELSFCDTTGLNIKVGDFKALLSCINSDNCFYVIVTPGHLKDTLCLKEILAKKSVYVGMIGSKTKTKLLRGHMLQQGYAHEMLARVHSPIGLAIAAQTPQEIAVSIVAQLIEVKNLSGLSYFDQEVLHLLADSKEPLALATIIEKTGSAPRGSCSVMAVRENGEFVGTIGGGSLEMQVLKKAALVLAQKKPMLIQIDMNNIEAAKDGMICGGGVKIFINYIKR